MHDLVASRPVRTIFVRIGSVAKTHQRHHLCAKGKLLHLRSSVNDSISAADSPSCGPALLTAHTLDQSHGRSRGADFGPADHMDEYRALLLRRGLLGDRGSLRE